MNNPYTEYNKLISSIIQLSIEFLPVKLRYKNIVQVTDVATNPESVNEYKKLVS